MNDPVYKWSHHFEGGRTATGLKKKNKNRAPVRPCDGS